MSEHLLGPEIPQRGLDGGMPEQDLDDATVGTIAHMNYANYRWRHFTRFVASLTAAERFGLHGNQPCHGLRHPEESMLRRDRDAD
jgi:hypothetical protein